MMETELIEAVRREKCLYDTKHIDYMNTELKGDIWQRIGQALNFKDGRGAKKTWERLRNNHRDALRRQKNIKPKSGSRSSRANSWRLQDQMAFLIPYMTISATNTNMKDEARDSDEGSQDNSDNQEIYVLEKRVNTQASPYKSEESNHSTGLLPATDHQLHQRKRRKRNTLNDSLDDDGSVEDHQSRASCRRKEWECATSNANDYTMSNVKNDPLFHFFISMYQSTKNLPPLSQHSIKAGMFSLLSQEESKQLQQQDSTSSKT